MSALKDGIVSRHQRRQVVSVYQGITAQQVPNMARNSLVLLVHTLTEVELSDGRSVRNAQKDITVL